MSTVWYANDTLMGQLIFLDESSLLIDSPKTDKVEEIKSALKSGTPAAKILSSDSVSIPLLSIVSISTDRHDDEMEIRYKSAKETSEETLYLSSQEERDEVYQALKSFFDGKFTETVDAYSTPQAAYGSLLSLTIFGILTWAGAKFAAVLRATEDYDIEGRRQGLKALIAWVFEFIGPIGVYAVGGILCAACAVSLFSRVKQPQTMLVLQETPYRKASKIVLGLKYLGLFAIWFVVAKIVF